MRAGVLVLGPLLTKYGKAKVSLPGGCAIGTRPVDLHLFALKKLGAKIKIKNGYIIADAKKGLKGTNITFPNISVGATENSKLPHALKSSGLSLQFLDPVDEVLLNVIPPGDERLIPAVFLVSIFEVKPLKSV